MSTKLSFKELLARRDDSREEFGEPSASRMGAKAIPVKLVLVPEKIDQAVQIALTLKKLGMTLRTAHDALNRLASGEVVTVELYPERLEFAVADLHGLGIAARPVAPAQPAERQS